MRKTFGTLSIVLLLAGCSGSSTSGQVACNQVYWDGMVGTCLPAGWQVIDRATLTERGVPPGVVVAFQAQSPFSGQFPTVTVTREKLAQVITPAAYSDASIRSVSTLPGYQDVDTQKITADGQEVSLHTFLAQPQPTEPKARFFQVSLSSGTAGYTFTGAAPVGVSAQLQQEIELIVRHASLHDPSAGASSSK